MQNLKPNPLTIAGDFSPLKNCVSMVKDFSSFNHECGNWRQSLHEFRDELLTMQKSLENSNYSLLPKEKRSQLEHLQNQLMVQLMNVHDLRQAVKRHDKHIVVEIKPASHNRFHQVSAQHESLHTNYTYVKGTLDELKSHMKKFISSLQ